MTPPMPELQATVNGTSRNLPPGCTVKHLLEILEVDPARVAVERNEEVVPRAAWPTTVIDDGDRIEVVTFVGGGA
jgi:thiamine biosynthesis protein ThiS